MVHGMAQCQKVELHNSACTLQGPLVQPPEINYRQRWAILSSHQERQLDWTPRRISRLMVRTGISRIRTPSQSVLCPDTAHYAAIVWAVFSFALLVGLLFVRMCADKSKPLVALSSHAAVFKTKAVYAHSVVQFVMKVASILWFVCFDFATFLSSQTRDLQVIIQVLYSSQHMSC